LETISLLLPCPLSQTELSDRAKEQARIVEELAAIMQALAAAQATADQEAAPLRSRLAVLGDEILSETAPRPVDVVERPNWEKKVVEIVRLDTNAVVSTRPALPQDRQTSIDEIMHTSERVSARARERSSARANTLRKGRP
jgi:hypothetical protein